MGYRWMEETAKEPVVIDGTADGGGGVGLSEESERRLWARCVRCGFDVVLSGERFMVHDRVWSATGVAFDGGQLCVSCVERLIGRRLVPDDFTNCLMNFPERGPDLGFRPPSGRLRDRMGRA